MAYQEQEQDVVFFKRLTDDASEPTMKSDGAAGYDISTNMPMFLPRNKPVRIGTGVALQMMKRTMYATIHARSSTALRHSIIVLSGVIDSDYIGELIIVAYYIGEAESYYLPAHSCIAQLIFQPCIQPKFIETVHLKETERGSKGFGSTDEHFFEMPANQMHALESGYLTSLEYGMCAWRLWEVDPPLSTQQAKK